MDSLHPYQSGADLEKMRALLQAGLVTQTEAYYIHPGELDLCLYNWLDGNDPWQSIYLWDDPADPGCLLGWGVLYTPWSGFDVFVQPELWKSTWAAEVHAWVEAKAIEKARLQGRRQVWRNNVGEGDQFLREQLCGRGFQEVPEHAMLSMECELERELPKVPLPEGFTLRRVEASDAFQRAQAQHRAFEAELPFEEYLGKYQHFMASPGFARGREWIVAAPDGRVASFCMAWPDRASRIGQIDPVGTHPEFQRKGFGKAVMFAGLRDLQSAGMRTARICVRASNAAAVGLYEGMGFRRMERLLAYQKGL
jgi:ribosomal protein S18 acetylase RimI-like enzyme